tara:strand:- start:372 stop:641 length:270 start_codon:yes stop_codon:yes gene_type:complete
VLYTLLIQPFINKNLLAAQGEGVGLTINSIVQQIQDRGYAAIPVGNQTLILAPVEIQDENGQPIQTAAPPQSSAPSGENAQASAPMSPL